MRKRRVIIFDHDRERVSIMTYYFGLQNKYEVLTYPEPVICPVWMSGADCSSRQPCADIIIASVAMPNMTGIELFRAQSQRRCKVSMKDKALLAGDFDDMKMREIMESGCVVFEDPIDFHKITAWLRIREQKMDLSRPLKIKRKERRYVGNKEVACIVQPNNKLLKGITVNWSRSGLCLKTDTPLRQEQAVTIQPSRLDPSRSASVRWAMKMESGSYIMGLQYT